MRSIFIILVVLLASASIACAQTGQKEPASNPEGTEEPDGQYQKVKRIELNDGECIDFEETEGTYDAQVKKVPCAGQWTHKVIGSLDAGKEGPYPGVDYFRKQAFWNCGPKFSFYIHPDQESWEQGDREITCLQRSFGLSASNPQKLERMIRTSALRPGDCFRETPETEGNMVEITDCDKEWTNLVLGSFEAAQSEIYPSNSELYRQAIQECDRRLTKIFRLGEEPWALDYRTIHCIQETNTAQTTDPSILNRLVSTFLLDVGECFSLHGETEGLYSILTDCSGEWDFQVSKTGKIPTMGEYPGEEYVLANAEETCRSESTFWVYPNEKSWNWGYTNIICITERP